MRVTVKLFARLREIAGAETLEREVPAGSTVGSVWTSLAGEWPALGAFESTVSAALNAEYTRMNKPVGEGDEIAFLPPVSGG